MNESAPERENRSERTTPAWMWISLWMIPSIAWGLLFAIFCIPGERMVTLVTSSDAAQLSQIVQYLDNNRIFYETPTANKILVDPADKPKIVMKLVGQNLLGPSRGSGFELFDQTKFDMPDHQFAMQAKRALQNELSRMIVNGSNQIMDANVLINVPSKRMFKRDQSQPTASIKLEMRGSLSVDHVRGIQNLVAIAVENLKPSRVVVENSRNELLSENSEIQFKVAKLTKQLGIKQRVENDLKSKLVSVLEDRVGWDNYRIIVNTTFDWEAKNIQKVHYDANNPAQVSGKEYSEENTTPSISGPPGVDSNFQDTGIGAEGGVSGSSIEETVSNYVFPWFNTTNKEEVGEIKKIVVSVFLNFVENENGDRVAIKPEKLDLLRKDLWAAVGLSGMSIPTEIEFLRLISYKFDRQGEFTIQNELNRPVDDQPNSAQISSKIYSEENTSPSIAGPPGVDSNVRDTGIGAEGAVTGSTRRSKESMR